MLFSFWRRPVTLLEMLIVMAILAVAAGIVAIGVSKAVVDQRFRSEVGLIIDELRLAQDLMLILGTDVRVKFEKSQTTDGIDFWIELETTVKESLQREIIKKRHLLKTIRGVFFYDENAHEEIQGKIGVMFLSKGAVMSRGIMRLATSDQDNPPPGVLQTYILLMGFPSPIINIDNSEEAEKKFDSFENPSFDQTLTQDTFSKLPDKLKEKEEKSQQEGQVGGTEKKPAQPPAQPGPGRPDTTPK